MILSKDRASGMPAEEPEPPDLNDSVVSCSLMDRSPLLSRKLFLSTYCGRRYESDMRPILTTFNVVKYYWEVLQEAKSKRRVVEMNARRIYRRGSSIKGERIVVGFCVRGKVLFARGQKRKPFKPLMVAECSSTRRVGDIRFWATVCKWTGEERTGGATERLGCRSMKYWYWATNVRAWYHRVAGWPGLLLPGRVQDLRQRGVPSLRFRVQT